MKVVSTHCIFLTEESTVQSVLWFWSCPFFSEESCWVGICETALISLDKAFHTRDTKLSCWEMSIDLFCKWFPYICYPCTNFFLAKGFIRGMKHCGAIWKYDIKGVVLFCEAAEQNVLCVNLYRGKALPKASLQSIILQILHCIIPSLTYCANC